MHRKRNIEQPSVCDSSVGEVEETSIVSRATPWLAFIAPLHKQQVMCHLCGGGWGGGREWSKNKAGRIPTNL